MTERLPEQKPVMAIGHLAEILETFEAPEEVISTIARRAGAVIGIQGGIEHEDIIDIIADSMAQNNGLPDWPYVINRLGKAATRIYKGKSPF